MCASQRFGENILTIGERLLEERTRLGLNQTDFAALGGVGKATQINYEKGERNPDAAYLAAVAAKGVDVLYVLTAVRGVLAQRPLSDEESALLDNYHHSDEEGRAAARRVLSSLAQHQPKAASGGKR